MYRESEQLQMRKIFAKLYFWADCTAACTAANSLQTSWFWNSWSLMLHKLVCTRLSVTKKTHLLPTTRSYTKYMFYIFFYTENNFSTFQKNKPNLIPPSKCLTTSQSCTDLWKAAVYAEPSQAGRQTINLTHAKLMYTQT